MNIKGRLNRDGLFLFQTMPIIQATQHLLKKEKKHLINRVPGMLLSGKIIQIKDALTILDKAAMNTNPGFKRRLGRV